MKRLSQIIRESFSNEKEIFSFHKKEIDRLNSSTLKFVSFISLGIFMFLCLESFIINKSLNQLNMIYMFAIVIISLIAFLIIKKRSHNIVLIGLYISFTIFFLVTIYLSAVVFYNSLGASIVGLLLLIPLVTIDKTWRIDIVTFLFYIIFVITSFIYKDFILAIDDMITCGVFTLIGLILGQYLRKVKLTNIVNQDKFKKLSHTDALTQLYNRRKLENFMCSSDIKSQMTGVIMIDIDFFKQYNDTYGHQQGDKCLEEVGACLYRIAKYYHLKSFRYGGEEFVMTSTNHSFEELYTIANDIKETILEMKLSFAESPYHYITISAGVSELEASQTLDAYDLIDKADKALYSAKAKGRNIIIGYFHKN